MKRTLLTWVMIPALAATSAFGGVAVANQGTKPAAAPTASTGNTMATNTHKRRVRHKHHKAAAKKVPTSTRTK
jgi:hypothetical protein